MIYVIIQDVYFAIEISILLCHIAFSYFITFFCYILHCSVKKRTIIITPYILLFTLVFHYADVTLCMTLSARIVILVALRNCVCITISGREHRDYKRIEAASPGCTAMKTHSFCQFSLVVITMMHTYIDYNGKICCTFVIFVILLILGADSQIFV